ncbi:MAG: SRPBCC domain-containing protein [Chloroflexi bacterium]|nr:SRPBCC domain-containing protein [Chloroflexota bacterium]
MPTHTTEITVQASPQRIFDVLTKPELVKLWQYGRIVTTDWKVGSPITFRSEGQGHAGAAEERGTILDLRPNELIKYSLFTPNTGLADKPENYNITSYVISHANGQASIKIIQEDNRPSGFTPATLKPILAALKNVAETNG